MFEFSAQTYDWIKAVHVIAVMAWMAGLLYLPRLFVYHAQVPVGSERSELFKVMERRLMMAIMNPAMIVSVVLGLILMAAYGPGLWRTGWFPVKAVCLVALMASHIAMGKWRRAFAEDRNPHGHKYFRIANEIPTLLMVVIVLMVVAEPF